MEINKLSILLIALVAITPILGQNAIAKKHASDSDYMNGYRAAVVKADKEVDKNVEINGDKPPPCQLPNVPEYCQGWAKGWLDEIVDRLD